jgi:predicted nucleic acid-binding protein
MVIIDTSVIINFLHQKDKKTTLLRLVENLGKKNLAISIITVQEIYSGRSAGLVKEEDIIRALFGSLEILPYNFETAKLAGEIVRNNQISFADAAIAATSLFYGAQLATLNPKDFEKIAGLELQKSCEEEVVL